MTTDPYPERDHLSAPFHDLMKERVQEILLVSSLYDSFLLSQDGQLRAQILSEFMELNLRHAPGLTHKFNGREALELAKADPRYNMIITTTRVGDMHVLEFVRKARREHLNIPIILLAFDERELHDLMEQPDFAAIDLPFIWLGDFRILLAIVKSIEDHWNVVNDTKNMGVPSILLIEDNVRFYSSYLPMIYTEVMKHTQNLLTDSVNLYHKLLRQRARPKILLCNNFEEAWENYIQFEDHLLGVITDIEFPVDGKTKANAGSEFARMVKERRPNMPVALQSFNPEVRRIADGLNVNFFQKDSPILLHDLSEYMKRHFGFGDFVFRMIDGSEADRATDLSSLEEKLHVIPDESLLLHGENDDFSRWFKARTEFALAEKLYPRKVSEYTTLSEMREYLIESLRSFRHERSLGMVADFRRDRVDLFSNFTRIGGGSMGGKARGLAFINHLLIHNMKDPHFKDINIAVPPTAVLCTDVYDQFIETDDLISYLLQSEDDDEMLARVLDTDFPAEYIKDLAYFLENRRTPLAIRSSSLLEDSPFQPFAGIYETLMLPNNHPDLEVRLQHLLATIKRIYASTFTQEAKSFIAATPYRLEEEKMGVIIQELVGAKHGDRFYPEVSGVARSHNFYPTHPMKSSDGVVNVALGLGKTVVDGGIALRFCPKYPHHLMQFGTVSDYIEHTQKQFYALDIEDHPDNLDVTNEPRLSLYNLKTAAKDGTLNPVASVYSQENNAVYDGLSRKGTELVTFAPILKHKVFPLPEIVTEMLELGTWGMGNPVEIEFAVNLSTGRNEQKEFSVLQMRPLVLARELEGLELKDVEPEKIVCRSSTVLGVGRIDHIKDIIMVDKKLFKRSRSRRAATEIGRLNAILSKEKKSYLLVTLGRLGSADPWLGIPVKWDQISGALVIVESGFKDFKVTPSQGAHFFQNLTSLRIGYFTVNEGVSEGMIDWEWLSDQEVVNSGKYVKHLRLPEPMLILMNGHKNQGVIVKEVVRE